MKRLQIVGWPPVGRRKRDSPEIRRGRIKFEGDVESFRHFARDSSNFAGHTLFRPAVLENKPGFARKALAQYNQRAVIAHAERDRLESHRLPWPSGYDTSRPIRLSTVETTRELHLN